MSTSAAFKPVGVERPELTKRHQRTLRKFLRLPKSASEEDVARAWAENYNYNKAQKFPNGDPLDGAIDVPMDVLKAIAAHFEEL